MLKAKLPTNILITLICCAVTIFTPLIKTAFASNSLNSQQQPTNSSMYKSHKFYQANEVQIEFLVVDAQLIVVFLPMPESLYYCPGLLVEKLPNDTVSIKFCRQHITDKTPVNGIQVAEYTDHWISRHPESQRFAQSHLKKSPFAQFIILPDTTQEIILYQDKNIIKLRAENNFKNNSAP